MIANKLKLGDTIGVICPSSPEPEENIKRDINKLKELGFKVKEGKHLYDKYGYLAGKDMDRASDFMDMFKDNDVDMILCYRGGYGSMRTLSLIDFNIIAQNPKIFVGFSDITTYLNEIALKHSLITFHGPMLSSNLDDETTLNSLLDTLEKGTNPYTITNPEGKPINCKIQGTTEGILVGGNLCLISSTLGTPYEIDTKDKILFIEDVKEEPYRIDRMLTQLLLAGKLQECRGFVLGQFTNCTLPHYERSLTLEQVLEDRLFSLNKPTLTGLEVGHGSPRLTLPIGAKVKLDCDNGFIHVLEPVVK